MVCDRCPLALRVFLLSFFPWSCVVRWKFPFGIRAKLCVWQSFVLFVWSMKSVLVVCCRGRLFVWCWSGLWVCCQRLFCWWCLLFFVLFLSFCGWHSLRFLVWSDFWCLLCFVCCHLWRWWVCVSNLGSAIVWQATHKISCRCSRSIFRRQSRWGIGWVACKQGRCMRLRFPVPFHMVLGNFLLFLYLFS